MQTVTHKELAAVEKKIDAMHLLGKKVRKLEKELADLTKRVEAPRDWRNVVGTLTDNPMSREADALGQEFRRKQRKP
ncbi:MAG: hypothetical protein WEB53_08280 [Akkermansiaceae bacterium]